ncbi:MAG: hypothetical protein PF443_09250 [Allgaiera sp.]|jgi:hypothetical protein|nr:hypothetical protein [Allgaiera sp.]
MKTEDEVAREKDQVQKMIGAKGAMEAAISRIARLEGAISQAERVIADLSKNVGDGLYVNTFYHGQSGGEKAISVKAQLAYMKSLLEAVK